ncbi:MAG: hypothetical protein V3R65_03555 [Acidiferrobacterales bacterium]
MNGNHIYVLFVALVLLISCSGDQEPASDRSTRGDHVWKDQVKAYDKAREVENMLKKAAEKNKDNIERQTQ